MSNSHDVRINLKETAEASALAQRPCCVTLSSKIPEGCTYPEPITRPDIKATPTGNLTTQIRVYPLPYRTFE